MTGHGAQAPADQRVVVTGAGIHTCFGDLTQTVGALEAHETGVVAWELPGVSGFGPVAAAPAAPWSLAGLLPKPKLKKYMSPTAELAVLAAGRALVDAGLMDDPDRRAASALLVATGLIAFDLSQLTPLHAEGTTEDGEIDMAYMGTHGLRATHPLLPFKMLLNMPLGLTSIAYGLQGENAILYPGPDQAAICLDKAVRGIQGGRFERALVGGSCQQLSLLPLASLRRLGRLAERPEEARPGSEGRGGLAPADAGAFVVLESVGAAKARGARVLAEVEAVEIVPDRAGLQARTNGWPRPDRLMATGGPDAAADRDDERWAERLAPARRPDPEWTDAALGHAGPAALICQLALACARHPAERVLLASTDPDGRQAAVDLSVRDLGAQA